jgi:TctA family transporter
MDFPRALTQIAEIHQQIAKGEIYRGYRPLPIAASGMVGGAAAFAQPAPSQLDPVMFVWYWTVVAAVAAVVGISEIAYNYVFHEEASGRRRTRMVLGQFLPGILGAAVLTASFVHVSPRLVALLPGVWAICFGIGTFSSRPYLPRASGFIALFYFAVGSLLLWTASLDAPLNGWLVGGTFGVGQLLAALVLYWKLERAEP